MASGKLLLIDGNNLLHRAYHAMPPLTSKTGEVVNAVFGFSNMLLKAIGEVKPEYIACAFDTRAPTFRHVEFEAYKAQRKAAPPDLYPQLPIVKRVLNAFSIPYFEKEGYEADDILATIATGALRLKTKDKSLKQGKREALVVSRSSFSDIDEVIILSGDRDVLQLVDGKIKVQMPGWNLTSTSLYGSKEVEEKFGITPLQMVDYKAMTGDPSDNIPGVAGIGPKTAATLLQKYKTLEGIYEHIDEITGTTKDKLIKDKDVALAAKKLVELDCKVDLRFKIEDLRFDPDWDKVREEFEKLGFRSILAKLPGGKVSDVSNVSNVHDVKNDQLELI